MGIIGGLLGILVMAAIYALIIYFAYWVIKTAVKNGVIEAAKKLKEEKGESPMEDEV